jgi:hypothetical protein
MSIGEFVFRAFRPRPDAELDDLEEMLGRPEEIEETNLPFHVGRCALRWKHTHRSVKTLARSVADLRVMLILTLFLSMLNFGGRAAVALLSLFE